MDWRPRAPERYALYFNCKTTLVETFEALYGNLFCYEGNRAIIFARLELVPVKQLKHCISLALQYHRLKHLPLLGFNSNLKLVNPKPRTVPYNAPHQWIT